VPPVSRFGHPGSTRLLCNGNATTANFDQVNWQPIELVHEQMLPFTWFDKDIIIVLILYRMLARSDGSRGGTRCFDLEAIIRQFIGSATWKVQHWTCSRRTLDIVNPQGLLLRRLGCLLRAASFIWWIRQANGCATRHRALRRTLPSIYVS